MTTASRVAADGAAGGGPPHRVAGDRPTRRGASGPYGRGEPLPGRAPVPLPCGREHVRLGRAVGHDPAEPAVDPPERPGRLAPVGVAVALSSDTAEPGAVAPVSRKVTPYAELGRQTARTHVTTTRL